MRTETARETETTDGGLLFFDVPDIVDPSLVDSGSQHETSTVFTTTFSTSGLSGKGDGMFEEGFDESREKTVVTVNVGDFTNGKSKGRREIRVAQVHEVGSTTGDSRDKKDGEQGSSEEGFDEIRETTYHQGLTSEHEGTDFGVATERKTAETEQLMAAEVEEKKTFTIRSVVNPLDGHEIPLQQAIALGIIRPNEGMYVNSVTGESKPIPVAMNEGLIKVNDTRSIF